MSKTSASDKRKRKPKPLTAADLELDAAAWPKFENLVKQAAKMGHKPHKPKRGVRKRGQR